MGIKVFMSIHSKSTQSSAINSKIRGSGAGFCPNVLGMQILQDSCRKNLNSERIFQASFQTYLP